LHATAVCSWLARTALWNTGSVPMGVRPMGGLTRALGTGEQGLRQSLGVEIDLILLGKERLTVLKGFWRSGLAGTCRRRWR
jgi:hypothetical protein